MFDALIWPGVVVICVITAFLVFRPAWMNLIGRISKASKDGVSFEGPQERGSNNKLAPLSFPELMKAPISATVLGREDYLKDQLHSLNLQNDKEKIDVLVRIAAS